MRLINLLVLAVIILVATAILWASSFLWATKAHAQPQEVGGLICATQTGLESVYAYWEVNPGDIADTIKAVNSKDPTANCGKRRVFTEIGDKPLAHVKHGGVEGDIYRLDIFGECGYGICVFGDGKIGYGVFQTPPTI